MNEKLLAATTQLNAACITAAECMKALSDVVRKTPSLSDAGAVMAAFVAQSIRFNISETLTSRAITSSTTTSLSAHSQTETGTIPAEEFSRLYTAICDSEVAFTTIMVTFAFQLIGSTEDKRIESALVTLLLFLGCQVSELDGPVASRSLLNHPEHYLAKSHFLVDRIGDEAMASAFAVVHGHIEDLLERARQQIKALLPGQSIEGVAPETMNTIRSALEADKQVKEAFIDLVSAR